MSKAIEGTNYKICVSCCQPCTMVSDCYEAGNGTYICSPCATELAASELDDTFLEYNKFTKKLKITPYENEDNDLVDNFPF